MGPIMPHAIRLAATLAVLALGLNCGAAAAEVVAVVSVKNPVTTLSKNQIADIFLGKANVFPNGERVVPIDQVEGSAAHDEFYTRFTGKSGAQIKAYWSKIIFTGRGQPPLEAANSIEVKRRVVENPNAIGYIDQKQVDGSVKVLQTQ